MTDDKQATAASDKSMWKALLNKRMLICVFIGFSSGLPLYFLIQMVPAWMRDMKINLKTIGLFGLVMMPYTWKFLWAPALDRIMLPLLGRRRGWMLVTQILLMLGMGAVGMFSPKESLWTVVILAVAVAFFSATQDVVIDAYRREILPDEELGLGSSIHVNAYRVAGLIPGGLALIMADHMPWSMVYIAVAACMVVGIINTLLIAHEPVIYGEPPRNFKEAVIEPFTEFFKRRGVGSAILVLAFMFFYKFGDSMATALITPFYLDVGFSKEQIGAVAKLVGLWSMIIGGMIGGLIMYRIGINKSLWIFGVVQMVSILGFAVLNEVGPNVWMLGAAVAFEYLGVGLGTAAFVAYMARESNQRFTATQYALFTSFMGTTRLVTSASAGFLIEGWKDGPVGSSFAGLGYTNFFIFCTFLAIPGMLLLFKVAPWGESDDTPAGSGSKESEEAAPEG